MNQLLSERSIMWWKLAKRAVEVVVNKVIFERVTVF